MAKRLCHRLCGVAAGGALGRSPSPQHHLDGLRVAHAAGIKRIIHAGAVLSTSDLVHIAHLRSADPELHVYVWTDSAQSATMIAAGYPEDAPPLEVLVEGGAPGARTGARTVAECLAAARVVVRAAASSCAG